MRNATLWLFCFSIFWGVGCGSRPKEVFIDITSSIMEDTAEIVDEMNDSIATQWDFPVQPTNTPQYNSLQRDVAVDYVEKAGVKYIPVSINGMQLRMIFDTGASQTLISLAEANYLYQKGLLYDEDILGKGHSQVADGRIVENLVINLREVIIGENLRCTNVHAIVSNNVSAPLLLGNEVIDRAPSYTIDTSRNKIVFHLKQ